MPEPSLLAEFVQFLRTERWRWVTPIVVVVLLLLLLFATSRVETIAPFIYRQF